MTLYYGAHRGSSQAHPWRQDSWHSSGESLRLTICVVLEVDDSPRKTSLLGTTTERGTSTVSPLGAGSGWSTDLTERRMPTCMKATSSESHPAWCTATSTQTIRPRRSSSASSSVKARPWCTSKGLESDPRDSRQAERLRKHLLHWFALLG